MARPRGRSSYREGGERTPNDRSLPLAHERVRLADLEEFAVYGLEESPRRPVRFGVPEPLQWPRLIAQRSGVVYPPSPAKHARSAFKRSVQDVGWRQPRLRVPAKVQFCVDRKRRREVLFALRRAGYSGSARKRHYRRSEDSNYRC